MQQKPYVVILIGATGDLSRLKVIPAISGLRAEGCDISLIATGRKPLSTSEYIQNITTAEVNPVTADLTNLSIDYIQLNHSDHASFQPIWNLINERYPEHSILIYMAIGPDGQKGTLELLINHKETIQAKGVGVLVEKPFGESLANSVQLSSKLEEIFDPVDVMRNDHYLHKDSLRGLQSIPVKDKLLAETLHSNLVKTVTLNACEKNTLEGRADYFDSRGMAVDWFQSHILQMLASLCADNDSAESKAQFVRSLEIEPGSVKTGQYIGYQSLPDVAPGSRTETFLALELKSSVPRWQGINFQVITGKGLDRKDVSLKIDLKEAKPPYGGSIWLGIEPPGGHILLATKKHDEFQHVITSAFERRHEYFVSQQEVEAQWALTEELQKIALTLEPRQYEVGTEIHSVCDWDLRGFNNFV